MKYLVAIFVALGIYGLFTDHMGASATSFLIAYLTHYGIKKMDQAEAEYRAHPDRAKPPEDTIALLEQNHSEVSRTTF